MTLQDSPRRCRPRETGYSSPRPSPTTSFQRTEGRVKSLQDLRVKMVYMV